MEKKFMNGDICKTRTDGTRVLVIDYKVNQTGGVLNYFLNEDKYPESVVTDDVLCEFEVKGDVKRRYFKESNLELVERASN